MMLRDRGAHRLGAEARRDLLQPPHAELRRADLRAQVAEEGRRAVVHRHHVLDVAPLLAALVDLDRREADALGPDVGRVHVVAARARRRRCRRGGTGSTRSARTRRRGRRARTRCSRAGDRRRGTGRWRPARRRRRGPSAPKNSTAKRTGRVDDSMNCGMPTDSAASCPRPSRIVALRSFDWFRIGVVAVRLTCVAIS